MKIQKWECRKSCAFVSSMCHWDRVLSEAVSAGRGASACCITQISNGELEGDPHQRTFGYNEQGVVGAGRFETFLQVARSIRSPDCRFYSTLRY